MRRASSELLIVDDDAGFSASAAELARAEGFAARLAGSLAEGSDQLRGTFDLLLLDIQLPDGSGLDLLPQINPARHGRVAIVTANPSIESATRVIGGPVSDYFIKPLDPAALVSLLRESRRIAGPVEVPGAEPIPGVVTASRAMREPARLARVLAATDASILLTGETGTGKTSFARAIHEMSGVGGPCVVLDCGSMPSADLVDRLLGPGRYGGDRPGSTGAMARAAGGTLFLANITEMPWALQGHLLRLIESDVEHGSDSALGPGPVRLLASTRLGVPAAVSEGRLREDLYYRIADVHIALPPLRQRDDDVLLLSRRFMQRFNLRYELDKRLAARSVRSLMSHPWPGNVRELYSAIHRAYVLSCGDEVVVTPGMRRTPPPIESDDTLAFTLGTPWSEIERRMLLKALARCGNDKTAAARLLGVSVRTVHNHLSRMKDPGRR